MEVQSEIKNWQELPISKLAHFSRGISWRKSEEAKGGTLVISIPNIKDGKIDFESKYNHYITKKIPEGKKLKIGDIIFVGSSGSPHNIGRNAIIKNLPVGVAAFASFAFNARPDLTNVDPYFLYYLCNSSQVPFNKYTKRAADGKYNFQLRDFEKNLRLSVPSITEQRSIAQKLTAIQKAIAGQEELVTKLKELKQNMMVCLFSRGIAGEKTKITEIGEIPVSWDIVELGHLVSEMRNGIQIKQKKDFGKYKITRIETIGKEVLDLNRVQYADDIEADKLTKFLLKKDDILFSHINSDIHLGKSVLIRHDYDDVVHGMNLLLIKVKKDVIISDYLQYIFQYLRSRGVFILIASRAVNQSSINQAKLKALKIQLPTFNEQKKIVNLLDSIDRRIEFSQEKLSIYQGLFKTLLNELMSGERRVKL